MKTKGRKWLKKPWMTGKSLARFRDLVQAQGGDVRYVDEPGKFAKAKLICEVESPQSGYLEEINACDAGETAVLLGGGREQKGDPIDYTVGVVVQHKVGDCGEGGDLLFTIHANDEEKLKLARQKMLEAHQVE